MSRWHDAEHPAWCNKKHPHGANPRRQQHGHVWNSRGKPMGIKVKMYPYGGTVSGPGAFFDVIGQYGTAVSVLSVQDLRSLANHILEIAHAAETEERRASEWRAARAKGSIEP